MKKKILSTLMVMIFSMTVFCGLTCAAEISGENASVAAESYVTKDGVHFQKIGEPDAGEIKLNASAGGNKVAGKLATPQNLTWNVDANGTAKKGYVSWAPVANCEGAYDIRVYRDGTMVDRMSWVGLYDKKGTGRVSIDVVDINTFNKSGAYTFSVQALGDGRNYQDSEVANSGVYNFVAPSRKLQTPTNIFWVGDGVVKHKAVPNAKRYCYKIYNRNKMQVGMLWGYPDDERDGYMYNSLKDFLVELASDEYAELSSAYVTVAALTEDIEVYRCSDESVFSSKYDVLRQEAAAGNVFNKAMENLYNGETTAQDALESLLTDMDTQNISNADLAISMAADSDLVDSVAALEELLCEETGIAVTVENSPEDATYLEDKGIDPNSISVIGAALNSDEGRDVSISFSKADESLSVDNSFYKNSVAVEINIDGVKDYGNLDIPIQMKMPVPTGVLPERFVILHYHADGTIQKIRPGVKYENDAYYATFVLTSFSPFVFCNEDVAFSYNDMERCISISSDVEIENVNIFAAAYHDGQMVSVASEDIDYLPVGETDIYFDYFQFDTSKANKIKIMMWENDGSLKPVIEATEINLY